MSTIEISELCQKDHEDVLEDFLCICEEFEVDPIKYATICPEGEEDDITEALLNKGLTRAIASLYGEGAVESVANRWLVMETPEGEKPESNDKWEVLERALCDVMEEQGYKLTTYDFEQ